MKGIVDRIEGKYFIIELENEEFVQIEKGTVLAREGDVVEVDGKIILAILEEETKKRKASIEALMNDLFDE